MDNSLKRKHPREGLTPLPKKQNKTFLIGKELKTKDLHKTAANRASGTTTKPESKPPDSLRREASQAAGAAPTLRYGPAGDSAPRLRFKGGWYGRKLAFDFTPNLNDNILYHA